MVKNAFTSCAINASYPFYEWIEPKSARCSFEVSFAKSLESSFSVSELKHTLQNRIAKAPYTSQTKAKLKKS
ncbi:hypothetical protein [Helicobacter cinaedi]|uniref:hypothetical protein n=1 Tax=Helicobacter cinaedi TaxID=213 RepID=UPI000E2010EC|nr:hypothetical protein [Helicobacter cinaedi]